MSNVLDLSVEWQKAKASIDAHNTSLKEAINLMPQIAKNFNKPSDAVNVNQKIANTNERIRQTTERLVQSNERLLLSSKKLEEQQERQKQKEIARLNASISLYNKVQQKLNALSQEYKDLAIKKELGVSLTQKEEQRYNSLQTRIQNYDKTLKAVDATMGKYQRNVGNYASGFNPISNSINQLTRELPAFTYSMQTGFMAISNNIPIFTDAISNAIKQNKELIAQGKPTTSVLSQIAGGFFGWQTLMGVGITLLTVYGKEIGEWTKQALGASKATNIIKEAQKQLNEASITGQKNSTEEIIKLKSLLEIAKDTSLSYKERVIAVKELQDTYPAYLGNLKQNQILAGQTSEAEKSLTEAILSRAKANAAVTKITENQSKIIDLEEKKLQLSKDLANAKLNEARAIAYANKSSSESAAYGAVSGVSDRITIQKKIAEAQKEINDLQGINNRLTEYAIEKQKESILLDYKEEKATKDKTKAKEDYIKKLREEYLERTKIEQLQSKELEKGFLVTLKEQKKAFEELRDTTSNTAEEYANYQKVIDGLQQSIDLIEDPSKVIKAGLDTWEKYIDLLKDTGSRSEEAKNKTKELEEELKSLFKSIYNGQLSNLGFSSLVPMFDGTFEKMWSTANTFNEKFAVGMKYIGDVAKDTFEFINSQQQAQYEAQYQRLEQEKENALLFAGESTVAQQNIQEEYERRRKEIQRRQAQDQQKIAIFNSLVNTAQGVTAALAMGPAGIPLAITIGILGAIQTAFIASQKIPQFYKGTTNAPEGYALTDERGAELHTDKYGNIKDLGSDKGARLKYLEKGDKIYTAEETQRKLFNKDLNSILVKNDIRYSDERTVDEIRSLKEIIKNKPSIIMSVDRRGKAIYEQKQSQRIKLINSRLNVKGYDI